jgi:hypothetical protein
MVLSALSLPPLPGSHEHVLAETAKGVAGHVFGGDHQSSNAPENKL